MMHSRFLSLTLLLALPACAGARFAVKADEAKYPISLSPALPDAEGRPLYLGHELRQVGELRLTSTKLGVFYGATGLPLDISDEVNEAVEAHGGEGVVALAVEVKDCFLNWLFPLTLAPLWPGCARAQVSGIVVESVQGSQKAEVGQ